jgi:hypothetical protein
MNTAPVFSLLTRLVDYPKTAKVLTFLLSWLITWIVAKFGFNNGEDWSAQISTAAALAATGIISELRNYLVSKNVKTIQALLPQPLKETGVANAATVAAVAEVVQAAGVQQATDDAKIALIEDEQIRAAAD